MGPGIRAALGIAAAVAVLAASPALMLAAFELRDALVERMTRRAFDPLEWRARGRIASGCRRRMLEDLLATRALRAKTRGEIVEILGEPDAGEPSRYWDLVYRLGPEQGSDAEWFVLRLGRDLRVAEYRVYSRGQ